MSVLARPVAPPRERRSADDRQADLLRRLAWNDPSALGELYDELGRPAYALALRVVREPGLAEDAVQDAFLIAWHSAGRFTRDRSRAFTWLMTIVHRRAVDIVRREQRRRHAPIDGEWPAADEVGSRDVIEAERVRRAVGQLAPGERRVIERAYFEGLTQSEIADELGLPLGTVKSRTFNGLRRLREALSAEPASVRLSA